MVRTRIHSSFVFSVGHILPHSLVHGIVSHNDDSDSLTEFLFLSFSNAMDFTYFHPFANTFSMPYYSHINMSDLKHSYGGMDISSIFQAVPEPRFHVTNDCGYNHYYQVNVEYGSSDISSMPASSHLYLAFISQNDIKKLNDANTIAVCSISTM